MITTRKILKGTTAAMCGLIISSASLVAANTTQSHVERGTIKEVDLVRRQLVVTDRKDNSAHRLQWNDQTKFTEHWKKVTPAALKAGERVQLTYAPQDGIPLAQKVQIAPPKATKHASASSRGAGRT